MDTSAVAAAVPVSLGAPGHLRVWGLAGVVSLLGVLCVVALARTLVARRVLRGRVRYELLPTSTCDLRWEDTHRAAWHWTNVRPSRSLLVPSYASALRVRFASDDGVLHTYLEGPGAAAGLLRQHIYPEVESRPVDVPGVKRSPKPASKPAVEPEVLQAEEPASQLADDQESLLDDLLA